MNITNRLFRLVNCIIYRPADHDRRRAQTLVTGLIKCVKNITISNHRLENIYMITTTASY